MDIKRFLELSEKAFKGDTKAYDTLIAFCGEQSYDGRIKSSEMREVYEILRKYGEDFLREHKEETLFGLQEHPRIQAIMKRLLDKDSNTTQSLTEILQSDKYYREMELGVVGALFENRTVIYDSAETLKFFEIVHNVIKTNARNLIFEGFVKDLGKESLFKTDILNKENLDPFFVSLFNTIQTFWELDLSGFYKYKNSKIVDGKLICDTKSLYKSKLPFIRHLQRQEKLYVGNDKFFSYQKDFLGFFKKLMKSKESLTDPAYRKKWLSFYSGIENIKCHHTLTASTLWIDAVVDQHPVYHINKNLLGLLENTEYKSDIVLDKLFINEAVFLFPKKSQTDLSWCVISAKYLGLDKTKIGDGNPCFYFMICNKNQSAVAGGLFDAKVTSILSSFELGILGNLFLYMATHPDENIGKRQSAVKGGQGLGKNSKYKAKYTAKLTPRMLGGECDSYVYEQRKEYAKTGTGTSKSTHWRRGHWRHQNKIVNGEKIRQLIWIKPTLVNPVIDREFALS